MQTGYLSAEQVDVNSADSRSLGSKLRREFDKSIQQRLQQQVDNKVKFGSVQNCKSFNRLNDTWMFTLQGVKVQLEDGSEVTADKVKLMIKESR